MRKLMVIAIFAAVVSSFGFSKDKKEYLFGRLVDLRTQQLAASAGPKAPNTRESLSTITVTMGKKPTVIRYSIIVSADRETLYLSCDRESSSAQPELKNDMDLKWRVTGEDTVEIVDAKGKKFSFEVLRRVAKNAPTLKVPPRTEGTPVAK